MAIGIEQLNKLSIDSTFATDKELQNLTGVVKDVILKKLGVLSEEEKKSIGITQYTHPESHSAEIIDETREKRFVSSDDIERWNDSYTKSEISNFVSSIVSGLDWRERVTYFSQLATTYPNPVDGLTVQVEERNSVFRYSSARGKWEDVYFSLVPVVTAEINGLMTPALFRKLQSIEEGANKYIHPSTHSADMITSGNVNTIFTHEDKSKLDNLHKREAYVHPATHPAEMIEESSQRRFVSDEQIVDFKNKYTKFEIDNKLSLITSGQIPKPAVNTYQELYSVYLNPEKGWTVEVLNQQKIYYYTGSEWIIIGGSKAVLANETTNGIIEAKDYVKLKGIEAGATKHREGDGYLHLPVMGISNQDNLLAAGNVGQIEVDRLRVSNQVSADGTIAIKYKFNAPSQQVQGQLAVISGTVFVEVLSSNTVYDVARKLQLALKSESRLASHFDVELENDPSTEYTDVIFRGKTKRPYNLEAEFSNVITNVKTNVLINQHGVSPAEEKFSITFTSSASANGVITLDLNNGEYTVNVHVARFDTPEVIANKVRNAILSETAYHVEPINGNYANTIVVIAPNAVDIVDPSLVVSSGVNGLVSVIKQGAVGKSERVTLTVNTKSEIYGTLGVYFNDGNFEKTFSIIVNKDEQPGSIATKIRNELIANSTFSELYTATIDAAINSNSIIITKKLPGDVVINLTIADIFCGVKTSYVNTVKGLEIVNPYWTKPLSVNGKTSGVVNETDLMKALGDPELKNKLSEVYNWKRLFDAYLNLSPDRELIDTLNDLFDAYRDGSLSGATVVSSTFAGYTGVTRIDHTFEEGQYSAIVSPTENPNGRLGEVWVEKKHRHVLVYNSGSFTGAFDIQLQPKNQ